VNGPFPGPAQSSARNEREIFPDPEHYHLSTMTVGLIPPLAHKVAGRRQQPAKVKNMVPVFLLAGVNYYFPTLFFGTVEDG